MNSEAQQKTEISKENVEQADKYKMEANEYFKSETHLKNFH